MFTKMKVKPTLSKTYQEAERVEAEKESIEDDPEQVGENNFEGMLKMMQKLSNRVIDLEKEKEAHKAYNPYYKKERIQQSI